jgi:hypothetical protein
MSLLSMGQAQPWSGSLFLRHDAIGAHSYAVEQYEWASQSESAEQDEFDRMGLTITKKKLRPKSLIEAEQTQIKMHNKTMKSFKQFFLLHMVYRVVVVKGIGSK